MSTTVNNLSEIGHLPDLRLWELQSLLHRLRNRSRLLLPEHLAERLNVLDQLDSIIGDFHANENSNETPELIARAYALRSQFEAANEMLYQAVRAEIAQQGNSPALARWLRKLSNDSEADGPHPRLSSHPSCGLSFDLLDELVCGILRLPEPVQTPSELGLPSPEMTAYQPTPARHILDLIAACNFSSDDVLIDLGSGLGHVPLLVSILTGIRAVGVEIQPAYSASARACAQNLNLCRVQFAAEDARMTDLSAGTVFYLFSPFKGSILADVLNRLRNEAAKRPIRICSLGPSTRALQDQSWVLPAAPPDTGLITVFKAAS